MDPDETRTDLRAQELALPTTHGPLTISTESRSRSFISRLKNLQIRPGRSSTMHLFAQKLLIILLWSGLFLLLAKLSYAYRIGPAMIIWTPTGALTAAMVRTNSAFRYLLLGIYILILLGSAVTEHPVFTSAIAAIASGISATLLATLFRWLCWEPHRGLETVRGTIIFLCLIPVSTVLESTSFALPLITQPEYARMPYSHIVFRLFAGRLMGMLIVSPFGMAVDWETLVNMIYFWREGYVTHGIGLLVSMGLVLVLPFAIATFAAGSFSAIFYYMYPPAIGAAMLAGIPGLCVTTALGVVVAIKAFGDLPWVRTPEKDASVLIGDMVLRLQFWVAIIMSSGLLFIAALGERDHLKDLLKKRERERGRSGNDEHKRIGGFMAAESSLVLGFVCNELRKPLSDVIRMSETIMGANEEINDTGATTTAASISLLSGRTIKKMGQHMLALLTDAYDVARIGNGLVVLHYSAVDLRRLLEEIANRVRAEQGNRAALEVRVAPGLPRWIAVDESCFRRIVQALFTNAYKHTSPKSRVLFEAYGSTRYSRTGDQRDTIDIDLSIIVTEWVLEHTQADVLLRPYAHLAATTTATADLSLAVASGLARCMGGQVIVFGQHGRGTIFSCKMPVRIETAPSMVDVEAEQHSATNMGLARRVSDLSEPVSMSVPTIDRTVIKSPLLRQLTGAAGNVASSANAKIQHLGRRLSSVNLRRRSKDYATIPVEHFSSEDPCPLVSPAALISDEDINPMDFAAQSVPEKRLILIVDDSSISRAILVKMLQRYPGLEVHEAANGARAVEACFEHSFSMLFLDMEMPEMNGHDAAVRLRREGLSLPIILTTANFERPEVLRQSGIDELLAKPVTKQDVERVLIQYGIIGGEGDSIKTDDTSQVLSSTRSSIRGMPFSASTDSFSLNPRTLKPQILSSSAPILIVDDNLIGRTIMKKILTSLLPGREIVEAADGSEAVEMCAAGKRFAIIYMDLEMRNMDGDVAATRIRNMRQVSGGPPIIAVTGHTLDAGSFQALRAAGINEAIIKPVTTDTMISSLTTYGILGNSPNPSAPTSPDLIERKKSPTGFSVRASSSDLNEGRGRASADLSAVMRSYHRQQKESMQGSRSSSPDGSGRRGTGHNGGRTPVRSKTSATRSSDNLILPHGAAVGENGIDRGRTLPRGSDKSQDVPRPRLLSAAEIASRASGVQQREKEQGRSRS